MILFQFAVVFCLSMLPEKKQGQICLLRGNSF